MERDKTIKNITAGIVVGVLDLPLSMAFAVASGATPAQGIYTAIVAGIIVGIFGGTKVQIAGPTGAFVALLASITTRHGLEGMQIATFMAGLFLVAMGCLRLGRLVKIIPYPVIVGFTSGIGIIIFVNASKDFFGININITLDASIMQKIVILVQNGNQSNIETICLAMLSLATLILAPKVIRTIPAPLVAMVLCMLAKHVLALSEPATVGSVFGVIPNELPGFNLLNLNFNRMLSLLDAAFAIAALGAIEALLSATAADALIGTKHDANKELIGQGLANIITPLFGGLAATGAIARTVTSIRYGSSGRLAAIVHSLVLILIILLLAPLASLLPLCVLSAILFMVAFNMLDYSEVLHIVKRAHWHDALILLVTMILTVLVDLVVAVLVGVLLALLFFALRIYKHTQDGGYLATIKASFTKSTVSQFLNQDVLVYNIEGPFFFGVAEKIEHALAVTHTDPKVVIFNMQKMPLIDITGIETMSKVIEGYNKRGVKVYLCEANKQVIKRLIKVGLTDYLAHNHIFNTLEDVLVSL